MCDHILTNPKALRLSHFFFYKQILTLQGRMAIFSRRDRMSFKTTDMKQRLEEAILGTASARSEMIQRHSRQGSASLTGNDL